MSHYEDYKSEMEGRPVDEYVKKKKNEEQKERKKIEKKLEKYLEEKDLLFNYTIKNKIIDATLDMKKNKLLRKEDIEKKYRSDKEALNKKFKKKLDTFNSLIMKIKNSKFSEFIRKNPLSDLKKVPFEIEEKFDVFLKETDMMHTIKEKKEFLGWIKELRKFGYSTDKEINEEKEKEMKKITKHKTQLEKKFDEYKEVLEKKEYADFIESYLK